MTFGDLITGIAFTSAPLVAALAATKAGAGWFTMVLAGIGLFAGIGNAYFVRKSMWWTVVLAQSLGVDEIGAQWWVRLPFAIAFTLLPFVIMFAVCFGIQLGTDWFVRYIF
jgi:hypothetical protein